MLKTSGYVHRILERTLFLLIIEFGNFIPITFNFLFCIKLISNLDSLTIIIVGTIMGH